MIAKLIRTTIAAGVAVLTFAGQPVSATPITGAISFSDGFDTLSLSGSAVVSDLLNVDVRNSTLAQACVGTFATGGACIPSMGTFANDFMLTSPIPTQIVYTYNGFTFTVNTLVGPIVRTGLVCSGGSCSDSLSFSGTGTVTGPAGFDPGSFSMTWMGQGSCTAAAAAAACLPGTTSGFWNARVVGPAVPEPATLALFGIAALLLVTLRRRTPA